MRGLDLAVFDFDYDLTWHALFLSPEGRVLGRFGGRDAETPGKYHSLRGLRFAMEQALEKWRATGRRPFMPPAPDLPEDYPAARRVAPPGCIHCHHVHEFRRDERRHAGTWKPEQEFIYPPPENVGLSLNVDEGSRVLAVQPGSAAAKAGMRPRDALVTVGDTTIASVADLQHALNLAPASGTVPITWRRGTAIHKAELALADGWRKSDLSWRHSLKTLAPGPGLDGEDLTAAERRQRGLPERSLAFRQGAFLSPAARHAGVHINDVILGFDDEAAGMTARQFDVWVRLNHRVGDVVQVNVLRGAERLRLPMRLGE